VNGNGNGGGNGNGHGGIIRILLADSSPQQRDALRNSLINHKECSIEGVVGDGERAARIAAQMQPDIAIVEMGMKRTDGSDTAESIAISAPGCQLIIMSDRNDPEMIRRAMQAGAREFLVKPVEGEQLIQAIYRVYDFAAKRKQGLVDDSVRALEHPRSCQVISVWGPKGGVGRTFVAVNLAVALVMVEHLRVLLMDGCLGFCTADVALDIESKKNILDLVVDRDEDLDPDMFDTVVVHHTSGLEVLLAPPVEDMLQIAPVHLQRILAMARRLYDIVIVDTRPLLDETTVAFLDLSDVVLTVCNPDIASLRNLRIFLDAASHLGYSGDKVRLVINRHDMRNAIAQSEIEKVCRHHIFYNLSNDHDAVATSINRGQPLVTSQPGRPITKEIMNLATLVISGDDAALPEQIQKTSKFALGRLFSRNGH
jgi:pilus assembly protein CpaE